VIKPSTVMDIDFAAHLSALRSRIGPALVEGRRFAPGILVSATIAMAATFISDHHGGPTLLYALLVGIAFHFLSKETAAAPGIEFSSKTILRVGVALLGARISVGQMAELGWMPILLVPLGVVTTILLGRYLAAPLGLTESQGVLTGGSVAICGASAALAISAVLPQTKDHERDTLFTVIAVTVFSTVAMIIYPILVRGLGLDDRAAGILLGGTIHDVAQVVGAGHLISDRAAVVATYVKLLRVAMLMPAVMAISWIYSRQTAAVTGKRVPILPTFLVAFAVLAVLNSIGGIPAFAAEPILGASRWCLVCAIAALGMKTSIEKLSHVGWRPLALIAAETGFILVVVLVALKLESWVR
jgi:uncharacterized integral membrane protein (TIGR00698 family)